MVQGPGHEYSQSHGGADSDYLKSKLDADTKTYLDAGQAGYTKQFGDSVADDQSLLHSVTPILGNRTSAINNFATGHYLKGLAFTGLAVTDIFIVKSLATAGAKVVGAGVAKAVGETVAKDAAVETAEEAGETAAKDSGSTVNPLKGFRGSRGPNEFHALDRAIERGVSPQSILNTLKNPTLIISQGTRTLYVTQEAAVSLNQVGQAVTIWGAADHSENILALLKDALGG